MPVLQTMTLSENICRIHSFLLGILEHELRIYNVEDREHFCARQER